MARIRTIKPEFAQSESVGNLSRDARLLFIQLWTIADDHGRARAAVRLLAGQLYPYDDDAVVLLPVWMRELADKGFIRVYQVDGNSYLDIPTWGKHQRIDNAGKSNLPEYRPDAAITSKLGGNIDASGDEETPRREPPRAAANSGEPPLDLGPRTIGPRTVPANAGDDRPGEKSKRATRISADWIPDEVDQASAIAEGLSVSDLAKIAPVFRDYWLSAAGQKGVKADWRAVWRNWCRREAEKLGRQKPGANGQTRAGPDWHALVAHFKKIAQWPSSLGPQPGYSGCRVPTDVLREFGYLPADDPPRLALVSGESIQR